MKSRFVTVAKRCIQNSVKQLQKSSFAKIASKLSLLVCQKHSHKKRKDYPFLSVSYDYGQKLISENMTLKNKVFSFSFQYFNINFESSLVIQFFKCYETTQTSPFISDLCHLPLKTHFSQKIFCYHVYQFLEVANMRCSVKKRCY